MRRGFPVADSEGLGQLLFWLAIALFSILGQIAKAVGEKRARRGGEKRGFEAVKPRRPSSETVSEPAEELRRFFEGLSAPAEEDPPPPPPPPAVAQPRPARKPPRGATPQRRSFAEPVRRAPSTVPSAPPRVDRHIRQPRVQRPRVDASPRTAISCQGFRR